MSPQHDVGLVLSGGGVRGAAHVGILRAFEERGIQATALSGASAGAIVAAMYAVGEPLDQIQALFAQTDIFSWNYLGLARKPGLFDSDQLLKILENAFQDKTFEQTGRELHVVATDLLDGRAHFFTEGPLAPAVMASASFPGVFSPLQRDGRLYSDGGIINNLPIEPLVGRCRALVGAQVNPINATTADALSTTFAVSQRAFQIATSPMVEAKLEQCDFSIVPEELLDIGLFEQSRVGEAHDIGYRVALLGRR